MEGVSNKKNFGWVFPLVSREFLTYLRPKIKINIKLNDNRGRKRMGKCFKVTFIKKASKWDRKLNFIVKWKFLEKRIKLTICLLNRKVIAL